MSKVKLRIKEEWRSIPEYEGWYEVSNTGKVRSVGRYVFDRNGKRKRWWKGKVLKQGGESDSIGNCRKSVNLCNDGGQKSFRVHCLVMLTFVGSCPEGMEVCHNDGNPSNNIITNLRYGTRRENMEDRVVHGVSNRGERCGTCILNMEQVLEIRNRFDSGDLITEIAKDYPVTRSAVHNIVKRITWKHI